MSNIMMPPVLPGNMSVQAPKSQVKPESESSFTSHMEQQLREARNEKKNLLGADKKQNNPKDMIKEDDDVDANSIPGVLQQLMADLEKLVKKPDTEAGQWSFQLEGLGLLEKLAQEAGMDLANINLLKKQMQEKGSLELADLFAAFEKHFSELAMEKKVVAPETDLPFLDTLLSRMGVSAENLAKLSEKAVNEQGLIDLAAYLKELQKIENDGLTATDLTDWEIEQFQNMLTAAGVSKEQQMQLFPEKLEMLQRAMAGLGIEEAKKQLELSLERLESILKQAIADVESSRDKANMQGFLSELHKVLSQSGFQQKDAGWNPVVQESLSDIYQGLQKMIDMAKVKIEKKTEIVMINEDLKAQWQASGTDIPADLKGQENTQISSIDYQAAEYADENSEFNNEQNTAPTIAASDDEPNENGAGKIFSVQGNAEEPRLEQNNKVSGERVLTPRVKIAPEMQQFTLDQISQGVSRGLKNNEHQLTLTLYPKELGEVKVDMQVKDSHLAVSFVMANSKVKELLEASMEDFKDNLERQGFNLEAYSVSVDNDELNDGRERFELEWEKIVQRQNKDKKLELPVEIPVMSGERHESLRHGGLSMFV